MLQELIAASGIGAFISAQVWYWTMSETDVMRDFDLVALGISGITLVVSVLALV